MVRQDSDSFIFKLIRKACNLVLGLFGFEFSRVWHKRVPQLWHECDDSLFMRRYSQAQHETQMTSSDNPYRRMRGYALQNLVASVEAIKGDIAECGCWRGNSAYQILSVMGELRIEGQLHLYDSFEGISEPTHHDQSSKNVKEVTAGLYSCSLEDVQSNLSRFSNVVFHRGYIPACFELSNEKIFRFVHIMYGR